MLTVKELEKALSRVENKDIEVVIYDEMFGGAEYFIYADEHIYMIGRNQH